MRWSDPEPPLPIAAPTPTAPPIRSPDWRKAIRVRPLPSRAAWNRHRASRSAASHARGRNQRSRPNRRPRPKPAQPSADQNLAEMAQRLEAALRRPAAKADDARARSQPKAAAQPAPDQRTMGSGGALRAVRRAARNAAAATGDTSPRAPKPPAPQKSLYDSLEQEMAVCWAVRTASLEARLPPAVFVSRK